MTRRLFALLPLAGCLRADSAQEAMDLIAGAATALSDNKPGEFLDAFDPSMPGYEKLSDAIKTLTGAADLECSIEVTRNEGDAAARSMELDWILRIDLRPAGAGSTHRQQTVKCSLRKTGKRWRIATFEPLDLFALPKA